MDLTESDYADWYSKDLTPSDLIVGQDEVFTKVMNSSELKFHTIAAEHYIAPTIKNIRQINVDQFSVDMEKFAYDLNAFNNIFRYSVTTDMRRNITDIVNTLIDRLHSLQILHVDFHSGNIVIKTDSNGKMILRLIDFGMSEAFDGDLSYARNYLKIPTNHCIEQIVALERNKWKNDLINWVV